MDKSTLSNYGWIVIVTLVLSVMLAFATPFGGYIAKGASNVIKIFVNSSDNAVDENSISTQQQKWENYLNDGTSTPITSTEYTLQQIEADPLMFPIGKNEPEYVVAKFNDDFTEVTIIKNGKNSDGIMKDWVNEETEEILISPLVEQASTLKTINIEDGVINIGAGMMLNLSAFEFFMSYSFPVDVNTPEGESIAIENYNFKTFSQTEPSLNFGDVALHTLNVNGRTLTEINTLAFFGCNNLKNVNLNNEIKHIGGMSFAFCDLSNLGKLPEQLEIIDEAAFFISGIKHLEFGNNIKIIAGQAFQVCTFIENDIILPESIEDIGLMATTGVGNSFNSTGITTFYGKAGSYAETWATSEGYTFVAIE